MGQARLLVVGNDPDSLPLISNCAQSLGYLLSHCIRLDLIRARLQELRPELLIIDGDSALTRDRELLRQLVDIVRSAPVRPQVLVMARLDDSFREQLWQHSQADDLIDKPVDALDLQVRIRSLVRVQRMATQALRDRDALNALFELSTFSAQFQSTEDVLGALARRVADWTQMHHVVLTLGPATQPRVVAEVHRQGLSGGHSITDRRHAELIRRRETLVLEETEGVLAGESPSSLPYVGVPLHNHSSGEPLGVLHAWGGDLPSGAHLRVLRVAAERVSTEMALHESNQRLEEMVQQRTADLTEALDRLRAVNSQLLEASRDTVMRLARAAEYRDGDTGEHVERMSSYSQVLARQLGLPLEDQALIKLAAPMHDVGKIGIRDAILLKNGKLTPDEWETMKQHPVIGAQILAGSRSKLLQMAEQIAASHHEKWDGCGYPNGLRGEEIPLVGRIVALADVFDALTMPRVYKDAWSIEDAVGHIRKEAGKHFDPSVVSAFEHCLDRLLEVRQQHLEQGHVEPPPPSDTAGPETMQMPVLRVVPTLAAS
jgi:response regulator RpfG family c-di-GMP phosphodiesterase